MRSNRHSCPIIMKLEFSQQIPENFILRIKEQKTRLILHEHDDDDDDDDNDDNDF